MPDCDAYNFVTNNSAFVLTLIGLVGTGLAGLAISSILLITKVPFWSLSVPTPSPALG